MIHRDLVDLLKGQSPGRLAVDQYLKVRQIVIDTVDVPCQTKSDRFGQGRNGVIRPYLRRWAGDKHGARTKQSPTRGRSW